MAVPRDSANPRPDRPAPESGRAGRSGGPAARTTRGRRWADRLGRGVVTVGGFAIIASILGILLFIVVEMMPLAGGARIDGARASEWPAADGTAVVADEYRTTAVILGLEGIVRAATLGGGSRVEVGGTLARLPENAPSALPLERIAVLPGGSTFAAATRDGRVLLVPIVFEAAYDGGTRTIRASLGIQTLLELDPERRPVGAFAATADADGGATIVAKIADGSLRVVQRTVEKNAITGEATEAVVRFALTGAPDVTALAVDADARHVWAGTPDGRIVYWPLAGSATPGAGYAGTAGGSAVTALSLLIGHRSLVVGQADGALSIWFLLRQDDGTFRPGRVRDFPRQPGAIRLISPSPRDKGFLAQDATGQLGLYYSTSHRTLWTGRSPVPDASGLYYLPKADGAVLAGGGRIASFSIHNPHPEVSLEALFGKVWYEGADAPAHVWQSSSGTDDFEPKLSLTPLLFGTLKGTFYSLILAIPLGVLGAMYTSQFMHPSLKNVIKPVVEVMAALPSVVLGFLAGLWLAPRIEQVFPALMLMVVILPAMALLSARAYALLPIGWRGRLPAGTEVIAAIGSLAAGIWIAIVLEPGFERLAFGGRFQGWLLDATGLGFDQRNAIVVGLAMGFAVIPIIFSVAEEAFSNVPRGLVAGSLALGATRWQTVTRVVLPSASPGIFSAIMVGFGRAVGETMIVLMATGNTPIMDWNPFNGFRTLSANIAVEIPEAPHGGTLYRALFLAGLLLFILTFVVNTAAEVVRQNLRRRFSSQ